MSSVSTFERLLGEIEWRNRDNVSRTDSYLELYALARAEGRELPWLLMAHLVSRNAGYMMTDLGASLDRPGIFTREAIEELFLLLERANFLIFWDAWRHVLVHLLGRTTALDERTPRFMRQAWRRYEHQAETAAGPEHERRLVLDLVTNEQNLIEHRVVRSPRFARALAMIGFFEATGNDRPIVLPRTTCEIRVGRFASLEKRIDAGRRIFDETLADPVSRAAIAQWAHENPHSGSRAAYGHKRPARRGDALLVVCDAWPAHRVRELWSAVHADPEPDPAWP